MRLEFSLLPKAKFQTKKTNFPYAKSKSENSEKTCFSIKKLGRILTEVKVMRLEFSLLPKIPS